MNAETIHTETSLQAYLAGYAETLQGQVMIVDIIKADAAGLTRKQQAALMAEVRDKILDNVFATDALIEDIKARIRAYKERTV